MSEQAWHFCGETLRDGSPRAAVGEWETYDGEIEMCRRGLHASSCPLDALRYAQGPILRRVEVEGVEGRLDDTLVCRRRKVLAEIDATEILREFARWSALQVVHLWDAPEVVVRYLETGDESIRAAARDAARTAARAAGRGAAWHAACVAVWGAAWAAAWVAARATARATARGAVWGAAWDAALDAALDAARAAAQHAQSKELERRVLEAMSAKEAGDE